jgi:hypothetical protein
VRLSFTTTASRGRAFATCRVSQSGSIGVALPLLSKRAARSERLAVQLLLASSAIPAFARAASLLAALPCQQRRQGQQRLAQVGPHGHLGGEVLAHVPVDEADVDDRQRVGQRLDLAPHGHAHRVGAEHDQEIVFRQQRAHLLLVAREPAGVAGMLGQEMRAVGGALLVDGGAQRLGERGPPPPAHRS